MIRVLAVKTQRSYVAFWSRSLPGNVAYWQGAQLEPRVEPWCIIPLRQFNSGWYAHSYTSPLGVMLPSSSPSLPLMIMPWTMLERLPNNNVFNSAVGHDALRPLTTSSPSLLVKSMSDRETFYQLLNVSFDASMEDIHRAFLKLAKQYHPDTAVLCAADVGAESQNRDQFHRVQAAYAVLGDESRRRYYDYKTFGIWRHRFPKSGLST